ncbi:hypothetical protein N9N67_04185 [Bacteriovoracaceae bacterium]|nr:hypothetical protein [Bacteriovoracaceae bacterium]
MYKNLVIIMTLFLLFSCQQQEEQGDSSSSDAAPVPTSPPEEIVLIEEVTLASILPDFEQQTLNFSILNSGDLDIKDLTLSLESSKLSISNKLDFTLKPKESKTYSLSFEELNILNLFGTNEFQVKLFKSNKEFLDEEYSLHVPHFDAQIKSTTLDKSQLNIEYKINEPFSYDIDEVKISLLARPIESQVDFTTIISDRSASLAETEIQVFSFNREEITERLDGLYNGEEIELLVSIKLPEELPEIDLLNNDQISKNTIPLTKRYADLNLVSLTTIDDTLQVRMKNTGAFNYNFESGKLLVEANNISNEIQLPQNIEIGEELVFSLDLGQFSLSLGQTYLFEVSLVDVPFEIDPNLKNNQNSIKHSTPAPPRPDFAILLPSINQSVNQTSFTVQNLENDCYQCDQMDLSIIIFHGKQIYQQINRTIDAPSFLTPVSVTITDAELNLEKFKDYLVSVQVNPTQSIIETNYLNNQVSFQRSPKYNHDLTLKDVTVSDDQVLAGKIRNNGLLPVEGFSLDLNFTGQTINLDLEQGDISLNPNQELIFSYDLNDLELNYSDDPTYTLNLNYDTDEYISNNHEDLEINFQLIDFDLKALTFDQETISFTINSNQKNIYSRHPINVRLSFTNVENTQEFSFIEFTLNQKTTTYPYTYQLTSSDVQKLLAFADGQVNVDTRLQVEVDPENLFAETNETNNTNWIQKRLDKTRFELAIENVTLNGDYIEYTITEESLNPAWKDCLKNCPTYDLSIAILDTDNFYVYDGYLVSTEGIGKSGPTVVQMPLTDFNLHAGGNYEFIFTVDPANLLNEINQENNVTSKNILLPDATDFELISSNLDLTEKTLNINYKITDYYDSVTNPSISVWFEYDDNKATAPRNYEVEISEQETIKTLSIGGQELSSLLSFASTDTDTSATMFIKIDFNNYVNESDEENNQISSNVVIPRKMPNLVVSDISYDVEDYIVTIKNVGETSIFLGSGIYFHVTLILPDGRYLEKEVYNFMTINTERKVKFKMHQLQAEEDVPLNVQIIVDSSNLVEEFDEFDNMINTTILFENLPKPDFVIQSVERNDLDIVVKYTQEGDITSRNFGKRNQVKLELLTNEGPVEIAVEEQYIYRNRSFTAYFPISLLSDYRNQDITLVATIDSNQKFSESDEQNNLITKIFNLPALGAADLIIEDIILIYTQSSYKMWVVVKNIGDEPPYSQYGNIPSMSLAIPELGVTNKSEAWEIVGVRNRSIIYSYFGSSLGIEDHVNELNQNVDLTINVEINPHQSLNESNFHNNQFSKTINFHPTNTAVSYVPGCSRNIRALPPIRDENIGFVRLPFIYEGNCVSQSDENFIINWSYQKTDSTRSKGEYFESIRMYPGKVFETFISFEEFEEYEDVISFEFSVDDTNSISESDESDNNFSILIDEIQVTPFE